MACTFPGPNIKMVFIGKNLIKYFMCVKVFLLLYMTIEGLPNGIYVW